MEIVKETGEDDDESTRLETRKPVRVTLSFQSNPIHSKNLAIF